jgi:hypothetical protein
MEIRITPRWICMPAPAPQPDALELELIVHSLNRCIALANAALNCLENCHDDP